MKKIALNISNILGAAYFIFVAAVIYVPHLKEKTNVCKAVAIAIVLLIMTAIYIAVNSDLSKKLGRRLTPGRVYAASALVMLVADVIIAISVKYVPVTDAAYMDTICRNFAQGKYLYAGLDEFHTHYLERYSNQWGLFLVQSLVYKVSYTVFGRVPRLVLPLLNIAVLQVSCFMAYKLSGKLLGKDKTKVMCAVLMLLNPVLYGYSVIFYTDTLSMPFVISALYFGVSAFDSKEKKLFLRNSIFAALFIGIGYCIKGNVAVIGTALVIYALLTLSIKRSLTFTVAVAAISLLVCMAVTNIVYLTGAVKPEGVEKYGFPMSHWLNMGLRGRGGYNEESFAFTFSLPDKQSRNEDNIRQIKEYFRENSLSAVSKHLRSKVAYTWSDAAYQLQWQMRSTPAEGLQKMFSGSVAYLVICFVFQWFMIICFLSSYISAAISKRVDYMLVVRLAVLGLAAFLMIWETRSRYMLCFLPLFIIITADGLEQIMHHMSQIIKKRSCD